MLRRPRLDLHEGLRRLLRQPPTPRAASIRWRAHAATLAVAALIVPSACAIYFHSVAERENEPYWALAAERLWAIHAAVCIVVALFWIFEKPQRVGYAREHRRGHPAPPSDAESEALHQQATLRANLITILLISVICAGVGGYCLIDAVSAWKSGRLAGAVLSTLAAPLFLAASAGSGYVSYLLVRRKR